MTMSQSIKQELFASYLAPILDTAYGTALYITGRPGEADCLVQEASIDAFTRFSALRPPADFKKWFLRLMVDLFRARAGRGDPIRACGEAGGPEIADGLPDAEASGPFDQPEPFLRALGQQQIAGVFSRLPEEDRIVSALYFMDDLTYSEIAEVVGCPVDVVRGRLHRGRKVLSCALRGVVPPAGGSVDWLLLPAYRCGEPVSEC
jgi:RNA polymerase sigma-70 factor, ECF subfamily